MNSTNNKRKNKGLIVGITIITISLVIIGVGLFMHKGKNSLTTITEDTIETESTLVSTALKQITAQVFCLPHPHFYLQDKKITAQDFSNEDMYVLALQQVISKGNPFTITTQELRKEIDKIAGSNYKFEDKLYKGTSNYNYNYNPETKVYENVLQETKCNISLVRDIVKVTKATKSGDTLTIYVRAIFANDENKRYYKNRAMTEEITDLEFAEVTTNTQDNNLEAVKVVAETSENHMKGTLYKVIFNVKDNNYKFISSEPQQTNK